ncbi:MAG: sigma-70 family RNA polymerase sigma factor [Gemmatimonadota bacterium]|jgi:RNA polymerase sigma factor (TIGR02999 family)
MASPDDITTMLESVRDGDRAAIDALFPVLYDELRRLARAQRREWRGDYTLNTTALVHEAYLKLVRQDRVGWSERSHFFALAAKAMRHILTDYARRRQAAKRGGGAERVELEEVAGAVNPVPPESATELLALDDALARLEAANERQARVVECRFFAGLCVTETAAALGISEATVKRDWRVARAILRDALDPGRSSG